MKLKDNYGLTGWGFILALIGLITAALLITGTLAWTISSHECNVAERQYRKHTHYYFLGGGCYIQPEKNSEKVLLETYQNFKPRK